jgi:hypothetical protein
MKIKLLLSLFFISTISLVSAQSKNIDGKWVFTQYNGNNIVSGEKNAQECFWCQLEVDANFFEISNGKLSAIVNGNHLNYDVEVGADFIKLKKEQTVRITLDDSSPKTQNTQGVTIYNYTRKGRTLILSNDPSSPRKETFTFVLTK